MSVWLLALVGLVLLSSCAPPEERRALEQARWKDEARAAKEATPKRAASVLPGDVVPVKTDTLCLDTKEGLDEVVKWSARNDREEAMRAWRRDGGGLIAPGERVKVLEIGIFRAKLRVIATDRECWTIPEAVR